MNYVAMYIILVVICLILTDELIHPQCTYVPKSKRTHFSKGVKSMIEFARSKLNLLEIQIGALKVRRSTNLKIKRARRSARLKVNDGKSRSLGNKLVRCVVLTAIMALQAQAKPFETLVTFDADAKMVGIDDRASGCISHDETDFIGPLVDCNRVIKGYKGTKSYGLKMGTIRWHIPNNQGQVFTVKIPNSYYDPNGTMRLLSPQHFAQTQTKLDRLREGTGARTIANKCTLFWDFNQQKLDIPLGKKDNVATFYLAPGFTKYQAFCTEIGNDLGTESEPIAQPVNIIEDDETEDDVIPELVKPMTDRWSDPIPTDFEFTPSHHDANQPNVVLDEEENQPMSDMAKLLKIHHQFNHLPFQKLQKMAEQGTIPKKLAKCNVPVCASCLYAKASKRAWRSRTSNNRMDAMKPSTPGQVVSVDQLKSPTPGLIAQMTGILTTKRYEYATIYVDQYSRLSFVYLQKSASADETIESKNCL